MAARTPKSGRIELRTDRVSEKRIRLAASIKRQSVSAFMLEAATERADQVIADAHEVVVPDDYYAALWTALRRPPKANRKLRALANRARAFTQRW